MRINANTLANGKRLAFWQTADAVEVGVRNPDALRLLYVPSLPDCPKLRLAASESRFDFSQSASMALGYALMVRQSEAGNRRALRHGLRHVAQFEMAGSLSQFLEQYFAELAVHGYRDAPLEVDARRYEGRLKR